MTDSERLIQAARETAERVSMLQEAARRYVETPKDTYLAELLAMRAVEFTEQIRKMHRRKPIEGSK